MKNTLVAVAFLVLALGWPSEAVVVVKEGGLSFSLDAVRRLQELTNNTLAAKQNPCLWPGTVSMCAEPLLPQEFLPLCRQSGASASLARLVMVPFDVCEICSFAACSGCS